jgi:hypothetical protein
VDEDVEGKVATFFSSDAGPIAAPLEFAESFRYKSSPPYSTFIHGKSCGSISNMLGKSEGENDAGWLEHLAVII